MMFAAGFGSRMQPLTLDRPKPLIEVAGKALLDHALDLLGDDGPIVVNTHYKAAMIDAHLAGRHVQTICEKPEILETGGGLRNALPLLGNGPVLTMNTDAVWLGPNPVEILKAAWDPARMDALLLCIRAENARGHPGAGDFLLEDDGRLQRGPGMIYVGLQIMKTDRLHEVTEPAFSLNRIWDRMHTDGRLFGATYPGQWCDVGTPDGIRLAETMLEHADA